MLKQELRRRLERLLRGDYRSDDLNALMLALRDERGAKDSVREVGDFVAHRAERKKGALSQVVRDVFASGELWFTNLLGRKPSWSDFRPVLEANYRLASNELVHQRLGIRRDVARSVLMQSIKKFEAGKQLTKREFRVLTYFGGSFIWKPAFTSDELFADFQSALLSAGLLSPNEGPLLAAAKDFVTAHAVALMHGSAILLEDGRTAALRAGFDNDEGVLEVKALLSFPSIQAKTVLMPLCVFLTCLRPEVTCCPELATNKGPWSDPIEVDGCGMLVPL